MIILGFVFLGLYTVEVLNEPSSTAFNLAVTGSFIIYLLFAFDLLTTLIAEAPWEGNDNGWEGIFLQALAIDSGGSASNVQTFENL